MRCFGIETYIKLLKEILGTEKPGPSVPWDRKFRSTTCCQLPWNPIPFSYPTNLLPGRVRPYAPFYIHDWQGLSGTGSPLL